MINGIVITVNLLGRLNGPVTHTTNQSNTIQILSKDGKLNTVTSQILHTDRTTSRCVKQISISPSVVSLILKGQNTKNSKGHKKATDKEKILSFVQTFDEGYGVSYE
jgi:hypothetical protein